jgi:hypothetical protein
MIAARNRLSDVWAGGAVLLYPDQQVGQFETQWRHRSVRREPIKLGPKPHQLADKGLGKSRIFGDLGFSQDPGSDGGAGWCFAMAASGNGLEGSKSVGQESELVVLPGWQAETLDPVLIVEAQHDGWRRVGVAEGVSANGMSRKPQA